MYKGLSQRTQRSAERRFRPAVPGTSEWMRQRQAQQNKPRPTASERKLRQRLDDEARINQAQRTIREGQTSQDVHALIPSPAGLRRSPTKRSPPG
jgi:hypothetical protein